MANKSDKLRVCNLRCEYNTDPIGLDLSKPRLSWIIEEESCDKPMRNVLQKAYQIQVSKEDSSFTNLVWDSGKVNSEQSVHVEYDGASLESCTRYYYRIKIWDQKGEETQWSKAAFWEMAFLNLDDWTAKWISPENLEVCSDSNKDLNPCPYIRKDFKLDGVIQSARVYVTSLGIYELGINGQKVGEQLFTPGWTNYKKRIQYQTYDVTNMLNQGENAIGIALGNGWYKGNLGWVKQKNIYGDNLAALVQVHITYKSGKKVVINSDENWKYSTGPILMSEIYHGEIYDARLENEKWTQAGYCDEEWNNVVVLDKDKSTLIAQEGPFVKKIEELKPINILKTPAGETVLDMGQNMVGWIQFKVNGKAGDKVVLEHAEVLDQSRNFYTKNLRSAKQKIEYILKGNDKENEFETYEPHFTFQGFRYVKLVEYPGEPIIENFKGIVIHSDMKPTGTFECSNELINQLQHNIVWGQKGNFLDVPTDCPQRDERLGWTGDAQVFIRTACFNMDTTLFFKKWLKDLQSEQLENGGVPHVIPHVIGPEDHSSAAWADAAVICPWTVYLCYGDKKILREQYDSMKSWIEYVRGQGENEYLWNTGTHFGDWVALDAKEGSYKGATSEYYIATAFYAYSTSLLIKAAEVLGKEDDASKYKELYENIKREFLKEFVTPNGRISIPTQTAHILALMFNLVEEKHIKRTVDTLVKYLEENNYHLSTGFVGTPYLCHVLSQNGYTEMAYKLVTRTDYPSWLYQVTKGATTIWEHWDGIKEDGSFWSADMNSFNHYAYGSIGDWLYQVAAGIDIDEKNPGYKHIILKPQIGKEFEYVKSSIETFYGKVAIEWEYSQDYVNSLQTKVQIPHNTTAEITLPKTRIDALYESGKKVAGCEIPGILNCAQINDDAIIKLGSGEYRFG